MHLIRYIYFSTRPNVKNGRPTRPPQSSKYVIENSWPQQGIWQRFFGERIIEWKKLAEGFIKYFISVSFVQNRITALIVEGFCSEKWVCEWKWYSARMCIMSATVLIKAQTNCLKPKTTRHVNKIRTVSINKQNMPLNFVNAKINLKPNFLQLIFKLKSY